MGFYSREELLNLGFEILGDNVQIDKSAIVYRPELISLGSNVRIDAFSMISAGTEGRVQIGNHVHIACGVYLYGGAGLTLDDFVGLSSNVVIYSVSDDFSGNALTGPTVPEGQRNVFRSPVHLRKHAIVGSGTVIMPGVTFGIGSGAGALSLVKSDVEDFSIVAGSPAKVVGKRHRKILELEKTLVVEH